MERSWGGCGLSVGGRVSFPPKGTVGPVISVDCSVDDTVVDSSVGESVLTSVVGESGSSVADGDGSTVLNSDSVDDAGTVGGAVDGVVSPPPITGVSVVDEEVSTVSVGCWASVDEATVDSSDGESVVSSASVDEAAGTDPVVESGLSDEGTDGPSVTTAGAEEDGAELVESAGCSVDKSLVTISVAGGSVWPTVVELTSSTNVVVSTSCEVLTEGNEVGAVGKGDELDTSETAGDDAVVKSPPTDVKVTTSCSPVVVSTSSVGLVTGADVAEMGADVVELVASGNNVVLESSVDGMESVVELSSVVVVTVTADGHS